MVINSNAMKPGLSIAIIYLAGNFFPAIPSFSQCPTNYELSGNWSKASSWKCGSTTLTKVPTSGDVVVAGTSYIDKAVNPPYSGNVIVRGTLIFSKKLELGASYKLIVEDGGLIDDDETPGNDEKLVIGGKVIISDNIRQQAALYVWDNLPNQGNGPLSFDLNGLPVTLKSFEGSFFSNQVCLSWTTVSEQNFDFFTIERSREARYYTEIGSVKGSGWSVEEQQYSFTDREPLPGVNYYRLKAMDYDGTIEYFPAISVYNEKEIVHIHPIAKDHILRISSAFNGTVTLTSLGGKVVHTGELRCGANELRLPSSLPSGFYIAIVSDAQGVKRGKMLVE